MRLIIVDGSEKEIFFLAKTVYFQNLLILNPGENFQQYKDFFPDLSHKFSFGAIEELESSPSFVYFSNDKNYENYAKIINPSSFIITKRKRLSSSSSLIEFGDKLSKISIFCLIDEKIIGEKEIHIFNALDSIISRDNIKYPLAKIQNSIDKSNIEFKLYDTKDKIQDEDLINKICSLNNYFFEVENLTEAFGEDYPEIIFNELHNKIQIEDRRSWIPYFIKYVNYALISHIKSLRSALKDKIMITFIKFQILCQLSMYRIAMVILDLIVYPELSELIITCVFEMFNDDQSVFVQLQNSLSKCKIADAVNSPKIFEFLDEKLTNHFERLLNSEPILQSYSKLDSFYIKADSEDEANQKLCQILENQCSGKAEYITDHIIEQIESNLFLIHPQNNLILRHLNALIPKRIIIVPSIGIDFVGKTLIGGVIAIKKYLLRAESKIDQARLLLTIVHEISHKKRLIFANNNMFLPKTPEEFASEAGFYMDKAIYGEFVTGAACNLKMIDNEIAELILEGKQLNEEQARKVFPSCNTSTKMNMMESDEENDFIPICGHSAFKKKNILKLILFARTLV